MKSFFLLAAMLLSTLATSAQEVSPTKKPSRPTTFGIRAGLNIADMRASYSGAISVSLGSRTGFHVGFIADIPVTEKFYVQPGLYLQEKGFKRSIASNDYAYAMDINANSLYLEIPLLASFRFKMNSNVQIHANVGPYIAYGIGGKGKGSFDGETLDEDFFGEGMRRFDAGLSFGGGLLIQRHYYIGLAYEHGLTGIVDEEEIDDGSVKNRNWMISIGYNF